MLCWHAKNYHPRPCVLFQSAWIFPPENCANTSLNCAVRFPTAAKIISILDAYRELNSRKHKFARQPLKFTLKAYTRAHIELVYSWVSPPFCAVQLCWNFGVKSSKNWNQWISLHLAIFTLWKHKVAKTATLWVKLQMCMLSPLKNTTQSEVGALGSANQFWQIVPGFSSAIICSP